MRSLLVQLCLLVLVLPAGLVRAADSDAPKATAAKDNFVQAVTTVKDLPTEDANRAGVPLGGIGAGKIDLTPDGSVTNITTNCNNESPISDGYATTPARIVPGGVPGIFWALRDSGGAHALKIRPAKGMTGVSADQMTFEGKLPKALYTYRNLGPIDVNLVAFSSLILGDPSPGYKDSALPGALFDFELANTTQTEQEYTLYFSWLNMIGSTGYYNEKYQGVNDNRGNTMEFRKDGPYPGMWFFSTNGRVEPRAQGNYSVRIDAPKGATLESRTWKDGSELWEQITKREPLKANASWFEGLSGVTGVTGKIAPGAKARVRVAVSWYFPNLHEQAEISKNYGRMYENWFKDSWEVGQYLLAEGDRLYAQTSQWQDALWASNLPTWLKYKLCDDLFPMITSSWYTKKGEFTISEAVTNMGGMLGTIDQRNASQAPYLLAFPKLCKSELSLFMARQVKPGDANEKGYHYDFNTGKPDLTINQVGAVPHDLGSEGLSSYTITPSPEWISGHWPDLLSGYIMQWYAYNCWSGDTADIKKTYESCKSTLKFLESMDFNKDGIPELWGAGSSSYDNYAFPYYGVMSYCATMYIAALRTMEQWSTEMGESAYAKQCRAKMEKAEATLDKENWTGSYYRTWHDNGYKKWDATKRKHDLECNSVHVSQLAGQWYASMMGLGYIVDPAKVDKALATIVKNNDAKLSGVAAIEYWPAEKGKPEHWSDSWPHYTEAYYAALAIYESQKDAGLGQLEKLWKVVNKCHTRWDTGLGIGGPQNDMVQGRWYMTNTVGWFNLLAISGVWVNQPGREIMIAPNLPSSMGQKLTRIPLFTERMWAAIDYEKQDKGQVAKFEVTRFTGTPMKFDTIKTRVAHSAKPKTVKLTVNGKPVEDAKWKLDRANGYVTLAQPVELAAAGNSIQIEIGF